MKFFPMLMTLTCSALLFNAPVFAETKQDRKASKTATSKAEQKSSKAKPNKTSASKDQAKNTAKTVADRKASAKQKNAQAQQVQNQAQKQDNNPKKADKKSRKSTADVAPQQVQNPDKKRSKRQEQRPNLAKQQAQQKKDRKAKTAKPTSESIVAENQQNNIAGETPDSSKKAARRPHKSGVASWYGGYFHGRLTANGERYNMNELTAAHRTLPFGTQVRVTNLRNNKSVTVRINDRGPYSKGRVIDLSRKANQIIDCHLCQVSIDVLGK